MRYKYEYANNTERQHLLDTHKDKQLIEEQNLEDGNFLVFSAPSETELKIQELEQQNTKIMLALAELSAAVVGGSENG